MLCVLLQASDNTLNPTLLRAVASRAQFFFTVSDFRSLSSAVQSIMPKVCTGAVYQRFSGTVLLALLQCTNFPKVISVPIDCV